MARRRRKSRGKTSLRKGSCGILRNGTCACRAKSGRMKFVKRSRCR